MDFEPIAESALEATPSGRNVRRRKTVNLHRMAVIASAVVAKSKAELVEFVRNYPRRNGDIPIGVR